MPLESSLQYDAPSGVKQASWLKEMTHRAPKVFFHDFDALERKVWEHMVTHGNRW